MNSVARFLLATNAETASPPAAVIFETAAAPPACIFATRPGLGTCPWHLILWPLIHIIHSLTHARKRQVLRKFGLIR